MWLNLLADASLFTKLEIIDQELAQEVRSTPCPACGGPLHQANFPRKPRGGPKEIEKRPHIRYSYCCGREGCRKRLTPPSIRFLGPKVYFSLTIVPPKCGLARPCSLAGENPTQVTASHGPGIELCGHGGNDMLDA